MKSLFSFVQYLWNPPWETLSILYWPFSKPFPYLRSPFQNIVWSIDNKGIFFWEQVSVNIRNILLLHDNTLYFDSTVLVYSKQMGYNLAFFRVPIHGMLLWWNPSIVVQWHIYVERPYFRPNMDTDFDIP